MVAIRDDMPKQQYEFASLTKKTDHLNSDLMDTFHESMIGAETPAAAGGMP
jgi:hypothetical protein